MAIKTYKGLKAKADKLYSLIVRSLGYCENCGKSEWLQTAHIISRRYNATRTDLRNAFCLCAGCHRHFTDHPREFSHFITDTWAADHYDAIYAKSQAGEKVHWDERVEFLKGIMDSKLPLEEARKKED